MNKEDYIRYIKSICKQGTLRHKNVILDETFQKELLEIIKCYEELQQENQELHNKIDKTIEYINKHSFFVDDTGYGKVIGYPNEKYNAQELL